MIRVIHKTISILKKTIAIFMLASLGLLYSYEIQDAANIQTTIYQVSEPTLDKSRMNYGPAGTLTNPICVSNPDIHYFMYHYVRAHDMRDTPATTDLSIDPKDFRKHMQYIQELRRQGKIYTMNGDDFLKALDKNCFPSKNIWIFTSDDGWSDTYTDLFPIAYEYQIPFFLGIIANRIDTPGFVTKKQIQEISKNPLFTITSHSITHSEQNFMDRETETYEMCESKKILENILGKQILTYIYPEGRMSENSQEISQKCGYQLAWSTGHGTDWNPDNPSKYDINRIRIHNDTTTDIFKELLQKGK